MSFFHPLAFHQCTGAPVDGWGCLRKSDRVMPAFASEFYFPEVFGRTEGSLFNIAE